MGAEFEQRVQQVANEQGWSDTTVGELAFGFLNNAAGVEVQDDFMGFIRECQRTENGVTDDECFDRQGNPLPYGRCDTCGSPCDQDGCTLNREHEVAVDITARPSGVCGCGYPLVWVGGEWQHDAAPYLWGDDHSAEDDDGEPHGAARRYWDVQDHVNHDELPELIYAYPGDTAEGFPFIADRWMFQIGPQWMAVAPWESEDDWFEGTDPAAVPTRRVLPIDEIPDHGTLVYRDMSGTEFHTEAHSWL